MATIAAVFHWPPRVMDAMDVPELMQWHALAVDRWNHMWGSKEG